MYARSKEGRTEKRGEGVTEKEERERERETDGRFAGKGGEQNGWTTWMDVHSSCLCMYVEYALCWALLCLFIVLQLCE